jgi:hypothetical protein
LCSTTSAQLRVGRVRPCMSAGGTAREWELGRSTPQRVTQTIKQQALPAKPRSCATVRESVRRRASAGSRSSKRTWHRVLWAIRMAASSLSLHAASPGCSAVGMHYGRWCGVCVWNVAASYGGYERTGTRS